MKSTLHGKGSDGFSKDPPTDERKGRYPMSRPDDFDDGGFELEGGWSVPPSGFIIGMMIFAVIIGAFIAGLR